MGYGMSGRDCNLAISAAADSGFAVVMNFARAPSVPGSNALHASN